MPNATRLRRSLKSSSTSETREPSPQPEAQALSQTPSETLSGSGFQLPDLNGDRHPIAICRWCNSYFVRVYGRQWVCPTEACARRQFRHALIDPNGGGQSPYLYLPTPAQVELRECKTKRLLWGGAAGGAKSHGLRWDAYYWCMRIPNYECLLMRRSYPELESTHLLRMEKEQTLVGATFSGQKRMMIWPNGSFIKAGHCESKSDLTKLLSTEYDDARVDEASTFEQKLLQEIPTRCRTTKPEVEARGGAFFRGSSNPGGVGAVYLEDAYILKDMDREEFPDYAPEDYTFIPAKTIDNPYLDKDYEKALMQLDKSRRKQLLDGEWGVFENQFFGQFKPSVHVRSL